MTGERSQRGGRRLLVKRERSEARGELGAESRCAAGCFIFCHGAFSLALRLPVIYRHPAASDAAPRREIDVGGDIWEYLMCRISVYGQTMLI